jgi:hypothetical protein
MMGSSHPALAAKTKTRRGWGTLLHPGLTDAGVRDYNTLSRLDRQEETLYASV